jgi:hypothetical protein
MSQEGTVNILFDSWSTQILVQQDPSPSNYPTGFFAQNGLFNTRKRLNTLLGAIQSIGQQGGEWNIYYTSPPITSDQLTGMNVYVSLTHFKDPAFAYQQSELNAILSWVETGGNVLLMTNHGGMPKSPATTGLSMMRPSPHCSA